MWLLGSGQLNAHSINNKAYHIHDLIVYSKLDIIFPTENWQTSDISPVFKAATPTTHNYCHVTTPGAGSGNADGGCGAIISRHIPNIKLSCRKSSTFGCMEIQFNCSNDKIVAYLVYRPAGHVINDFYWWILRVY